jgi:hypothetical protein
MTRMRFRSDAWHFADHKRKSHSREQLSSWHYTPEQIAMIEGIAPAQPGDTWRVHWYAAEGLGPICGYAICCPRCTEIHLWSTASNCASRIPDTASCAHSGVGSCWQWSGSAEDGTLTAQPSLYAVNACGWHGWLTNGELQG